MKNVVGLFESIRDAEAVVRDLRDAGISDADISFASRNPDAATMEANAYTAEGHSEAAEGAGFGATGGTIIGGLTGLLVGLGAIAIPGVGPVVAAGTLATALGSTALGAGIGAATGGLLGALVGAGIPEEDAHVYSEGIRRGGALVMAQVDDQRIDTALDIMERHNVVDIDERGNTYRSSGWSRFDENDPSYGETGYAERAVGTDQRSNLGTTGMGLGTTGMGLGTSGAGMGMTGTGLGATDTGYSSTTGGTLDTDYSRSMDTGTTNTGMTGTNYGDADRVPDSGDYDRSSKLGTAGGALAGAATGAAIGSAGGPVGTVVGGIAGAVTGGGIGAAGDAVGAEISDNDAGQTGSTARGMTGTGGSAYSGPMGGTSDTRYSGAAGGTFGATDIGDNSTWDTGTSYGSTQSTMGDASTRRFRSRSYEVGGTTSNTGTDVGSTDPMAARIERATEQGIDGDFNRDTSHHDRRDNY